ncbi:hypothetical protein DFP72DRAFT_882048 [Ephemerocybe angulata]|uniref:F-box domain-containing protein n=1 Tax=Ephemerocybe angulata TaxID=980116 RepID=A0A8H6I7J5_9AGAR|nr:hypothetical protein DFP72DRAFT_882048 [Tulosesus angulatus]
MELTDIRHLLNSNNTPNSIEGVALKAKLAELTTLSNRLRAQLEEVEDQMAQYRGVLSIMRSMPCEILSLVFSFAFEVPLPLDRAGRDVLLTFGLVCRNWRNASLLNHQFWCGLTISPGDLRDMESYEKIVTWFGRGGHFPKSLYLLSPLGDPDANGLLTSDTTLKLLTQGPVLDHLSFECEDTAVLGKFVHSFDRVECVEPLKRPWDSLRSLEVIISGGVVDGWYFHTRGTSKNIFFSLPPVTSFSVHFPNQHIAFDSDLASVPSLKLGIPQSLLGRLKSLDITCGWKGPHILSILQNCRRLESLTVDMDGMPFDEVIRPSMPLAQPPQFLPIRLAKLRVLRLQNQAKTLRLLDFLITPALTTLDISMHGCDASAKQPNCDWLVNAIVGLIQARSHCEDTLRTLRLHDMTFNDPGDLIAILAVQPALRSLTLDKINLRIFSWFWQSPITRDTLANLVNLSVLQISLKDSYNIMKEIFAFFKGWVPRHCEVCLSFQEALIPDTNAAIRCWKGMYPELLSSWEDMGISFSIVP